MPTDPRHRQARLRYELLAKRLYGPFQRALIVDFSLLVLTCVLAIVVASQTRALAPAVVVAWVGSAVALVVAWGWLLDADRRAAFEVLMDHTNRESKAWEADTGTRLPTTVSSVERRLRDHPDQPGRATLLARLGRLDEARSDLRSKTAPTAEEALHGEIFLRQLDVLEGQSPDTSDLYERWRALPASTERDFRRECLATLDAHIAADRGQDPWPVFATARPDVRNLDPLSRPTRYTRILVTMHVLLAFTVWFTAAFVAG